MGTYFIVREQYGTYHPLAGLSIFNIVAVRHASGVPRLTFGVLVDYLEPHMHGVGSWLTRHRKITHKHVSVVYEAKKYEERSEYDTRSIVSLVEIGVAVFVAGP